MVPIRYLGCLFLFCLFWPERVCSQETGTKQRAARYLDLNLRSLERYSRRLDRQQTQLMRRLRRGEARVRKQWHRKDSAGYARYIQDEGGIESLDSQLRRDGLAAGQVSASQKSVDSLRAVLELFEKHGGTDQTGRYLRQLDRLGTDLGRQEAWNRQLDQYRSRLLSSAPAGLSLGGIEKPIYYGKQRIQVWKQVAGDPSVAEERLMEYLQGLKGFSFEPESESGLRQSASAGPGMQTRQSVNEGMQKRYGSGLDQLQQRAIEKIAGWREAREATGAVRAAQGQLKGAQQGIRQAGAAFRKPQRNAGLPAFRINPMRGLPFRKRVVTGYNLQFSRASAIDQKPALAELSLTALFKHSPALSYGLGISGAMSLGQGWSQLQFRYEGMGLRTQVNYELIWGFAASGGYERFYRSAGNWQLRPGDNAAEFISGPHNSRTFQESLILGISRKYRLNSRWEGAVYLMYDIWWREKRLGSPLIFRIANFRG